MKTLSYTITGESPLLMHNSQLSNPLSPITKEIKKISGKRKKTDEDHEDLMELEWRGGLYWDETLGPYIPGINIEVTIRDAARMSRRGKDIERNLQVITDKAKLIYKGPRDKDKMWAKAEFRDVRSVRVQSSRLMRTRPCFSSWSATFDIAFDETGLDQAEIDEFIELAGQKVGLGDFRPRFGRFSVGEVQELKHAA